jgi:adhesin transport system outer membrane protein
MKTTTRRGLCRLAFFYSTIAAFSAPAMPIEEAVANAIARDPAVMRKIADVHKSTGYTREVKSELYPQVGIEGSAGWARSDRDADGASASGRDLFSRSVSLRARQLLWDGGFHWYRWQDAKERELAAALLKSNEQEIIALEAAAAFVDVRRARLQVELAKENLRIHGSIWKLAGERVEASGSKADVSLSSARENLAKTLLRERELALSQANARFLRYVGVMPPSDLPMPSLPRLSSKDGIEPRANFHYRAVAHQMEAALLAKKSVEKRYYPRVYLQGSGTLGEDVAGVEGRDNEASALVVVNWDIFDAGRRKGLIEQALADVEQQEALLNLTLADIKRDIDSRWADFSTAGERIAILGQYAGELGATVTIYNEQFGLGTRQLLSLLDIQNEEISARIRLTDETHDRLLVAYDLLALGGNLVATLTTNESSGKAVVKGTPSK